MLGVTGQHQQIAYGTPPLTLDNGFHMSQNPGTKHSTFNMHVAKGDQVGKVLEISGSN